MTYPELREAVNKSIRQAQTARAIRELEAYVKEHSLYDTESELISISANYEENERNKRMFIVSAGEYGIALAKVNASLLGLLNRLADQQPAARPDPAPAQPASEKHESASGNSGKTKILFLAANPDNTGKLRLDKEYREIQESIRMSEGRDRFALEQRFAVRNKDLRRAMLDIDPNIVHFSGHGFSAQDAPEGLRTLKFNRPDAAEGPQPEGLGIALEDDQGQAKLVSTEALSDFFSNFADHVQCVLLNACYSKTQAEAIVEHIPYVIGMSQAVPDLTAIEFATAFYDAIGAGKDIPKAFSIAKSSISMSGLSGENIPRLLEKK